MAKSLINAKLALIVGSIVLCLLGLLIFQKNREYEASLPVWIEGISLRGEPPFTVGYAPPFKESVDRATAEWNRQIGCPVFSMSSLEVSLVSVVPATGTPCGSMNARGLETINMGAGTWHCIGGSAEVHFFIQADPSLEYKMMAHELGHTIGLAHSGGIMQKNIQDERSVWIVEKQKQAVRERYCK